MPFFGYLLLLIELAFISRYVSADEVARQYYDELLRTDFADVR
jgi:hypothetical protein